MGKIIWLVCILMLAVVSCGRDNEPGPVPDSAHITSPDIDDPDSTQLNLRAKTYLRSAWLQPCDIENQSQELEVTKALDDHSSFINGVFATAKPIIGAEFIHLGPIILSRLKNQKRSVKDEWKSFETSWSEVFKEYQTIKEKPNSVRWYLIDATVKSILSNDRARLYYFGNLQLGKDSEPQLRREIDIVTKCEKNSSCLWIYRDDENFAFRKANYIYDWYGLNIMQKVGDERKEWLESYLKRLTTDYYNTYGFTVNKSVKRLTAKTLELPLKIGDFSGSEEEISQTVEKIWSSPSLKIKIRWANAQEDVYELKANASFSERSYVDRESKTVILFSGGTMDEIAHEIGHVLGFPDRYYTVFESSGCLYRTQINEGDLMSNGFSGSITKHEWQELEKHYPN